MAIPQTYYLDSATLSAATCVYLDVQLTTCAPNGVYSDGIVTREMVDCVLLPAQECAACGFNCDGSISTIDSGIESGVTYISLATGTATGAVLLRIRAYNKPNGFKVIYNSQVYNKLSSAVDGAHKSTNPIGYTFVGATASDCGISGTTYTALPYYIYKLGGFELQPATQSLTVAPGDVSLSASDPDGFLMVIPKPLATPSNMDIYIVGLCPDDNWAIETNCPSPLTSFLSTTTLASCELACSGITSQSYYFASILGSGDFGLYDFVFYDAYGQTALPDGYYGTWLNELHQCIHVVNGVIVEITECPCISVLITNVTTQTGVNSIRFQYYDCDNVFHATSPVGPTGTVCIQTTLANLAAMTYVWADNHLPAPTPADFTTTINGCL
jgi:hypothetical protein